MKFQNPVSFSRKKNVHDDSTVMRDRKYTPHSEFKYETQKKNDQFEWKMYIEYLKFSDNDAEYEIIILQKMKTNPVNTEYGMAVIIFVMNYTISILHFGYSLCVCECMGSYIRIFLDRCMIIVQILIPS